MIYCARNRIPSDRQVNVVVLVIPGLRAVSAGIGRIQRRQRGLGNGCILVDRRPDSGHRTNNLTCYWIGNPPGMLRQHGRICCGGRTYYG